MLRLAAFFLLSIGPVILSRPNLFDLRSHAFYRFLGFESLLGLVIMNFDKWFLDPASPLQIISWALLISSAVLAIHSFYLLYRYGGTDGGIENTTVIVRTGIYRFIRHPLYSSLLWLAWGVYLKSPTIGATILIVFCTLSLFLTAKVEEGESTRKFGDDYLEYMKSSKMFIPYIF